VFRTHPPVGLQRDVVAGCRAPGPKETSCRGREVDMPCSPALVRNAVGVRRTTAMSVKVPGGERWAAWCPPSRQDQAPVRLDRQPRAPNASAHRSAVPGVQVEQPTGLIASEVGVVVDADAIAGGGRGWSR
jgi:hypothetical protein